MSILYFFSKVSDKVSDVNLPDISIIKKLACEGTTRINEIFDISIWKRLRSCDDSAVSVPSVAV